MASLTVTNTNGETRIVEATTGLSVMENIRKAGFDDLQALCGGSCSCATCHVIVHPDHFEQVGLPGEDEHDLLESSDERTPTSRLSCQIPFEPVLDGLCVTIAREG
ncbi:2Fe-2S iron-sulfur cluster-binding protein [Lichenicoccus sp.]|uniref:2Fe-2S iron-sulfur cluster-binding protein n=1 Tax=Lichenicoccus sp. TaxID=2781899 RepID=UPI003D13D9DE